MPMRTGVVVLAVLIGVVCTVATSGEQEKMPGIGPAGPVIRVQTGFAFTEGPASDAKGDLYFTDIPNCVIHKLDANGRLTVFRKGVGHANGLMFNARGELVACEMDGRVTAFAMDGKGSRVLAEEHDGKRFNAPNDLVIDRQGGIYFTDPSYRAPKPFPQGVLGVYYRTPAGGVKRLVEGLPNPNGVILSPDESTLYVVPTGQAEVMAYPVEAPGKIGKGRVFGRLKQPPGKKNSGGDGLTIDTKGNLYITSGLGVQIFSAKGEHLGIIRFPENPANCTFGGKDMRTLYVTARTSLYSVRMEAAGHRFCAAK